MRRRAALALACAAFLASCGTSDDRVVVAAGTTLVDSGVLDALAADFEADRPDIEISIVGRATEEVLELGSRNAADLLITHAPAREAEYLARHPSARARSLFTSRFLLAAPRAIADGLGGLSPAAALAEIAAAQIPFVTRADGSGTYERELQLWAAAGVAPSGDWYRETGQGMGLSLQVADQSGSAILVEEGSFLASQDRLSLVPVNLTVEDGSMDNPYTAITVGESAAASAFVAWLLSERGRASLQRVNLDVFGLSVFAP